MVGIEGVNRVISKIKRWVVDTIASHAGVDDAHHAKYTDAEAVSAIVTADKYMKNDADDITSGRIGQKISSFGLLTRFGIRYPMLQLDTTDDLGYGLGMERKDVSNANGPAMHFFARSPGIVGLDDILFGIDPWAWDGTDYSIAALIVGYVDGNVTNNCIPSRISISTRPEGDTNVAPPERLSVRANGNIDIKDNKLTNPKNHVASALSGTKKVVEIDIGGTSYYFEVHPTKA